MANLPKPREVIITTPSPVMHVITNLVGNAGAEIMLARLLRNCSNENIWVVPLIDVSDQNRNRVASPHVHFMPLQMNSVASAFRGTLKLSSLIKREKPRVVVCWMYHAMVVATVAQKLSRIDVPVFWNVRQSLDDPASLSASTRLAVRSGKYLSRFPSGIIYNSARALELHGKQGYRNTNAIVIPNGFDIPESIDISRHSPRIFGIAGRFHPQKDYENFFRAAAAVARKFPKARFKAAGNGVSASNTQIAAMLNKVGMPAGSLELCGEVTDMASFYKGIDVFVLSSRTEGFPNVVAEAMSYGKPVITTDVGDAAKIVSGTGWVVPPRDSVALGAAIEQALGLTSEQYANAANSSRRRIEEDYTIASVKRRYESFLSCGSL
jgi:glycosyltransferase involved in cell wall biosynthesis